MSLKAAATSVLEVIEAGYYRVDDQVVHFRTEQTAAETGTRLYTPEELTALKPHSGVTAEIRVVSGTTQTVAQSMTAAFTSKVGLLNFASARNPGGGFLNGAKAQEEDLCRCSGLYPCLLRCPKYYDENRNQMSLLYTDYAIFSPNVPFFKTRGTGEFLSHPYFVSVITAPAPNSRPFLRSNPDSSEELQSTFIQRWKNVLRIAQDQSISRLLLGAWGCGAFGGDPVMASESAMEAIRSDGGGIEEIVFAIPDKGRQSKENLEAFRATFGSTDRHF